VSDEKLIYDPEVVARGDARLDEGAPSIESPLRGVTPAAWTEFVRRMAVAPLSSVSAANALGLFAIMPRRLADLGVVGKLARRKSPEGRTIWVAVFIPPLTCAKFLRSPVAQYAVFSRSMCDYAGRLASGEIANEPCVSLSGALAILHRCGPEGLDAWEQGKRFPSTEQLVERVEGIF
jgi:hypothetical protein